MSKTVKQTVLNLDSTPNAQGALEKSRAITDVEWNDDEKVEMLIDTYYDEITDNHIEPEEMEFLSQYNFADSETTECLHEGCRCSR
tara:strand:- start:58 stop:315 length:258 start_codon:yes stop_codon:yes gene_type:complete